MLFSDARIESSKRRFNAHITYPREDACLIADDYVSHLIRETRTSHESIVVLDGYTEVTTKVHIQRQRNPCQTLDNVVHDNTVLDFLAKIFLSNPGPANKQGFIDLLDEKINANQD